MECIIFLLELKQRSKESKEIEETLNLKIHMFNTPLDCLDKKIIAYSLGLTKLCTVKLLLQLKFFD